MAPPDSSLPRGPLPKPQSPPQPGSLKMRIVSVWSRWVQAYPIGSVRHARGEAYASRGAVLSVTPYRDTVTCIVAESKSETCQVHLLFRPFSEEQVVLVESLLAAGAAYELIFVEHAAKVLPRHFEEVKTKCSCADWLHPCQHSIAALSVLGSYLAMNPGLYFQLRLPFAQSKPEAAPATLSPEGFPEDFLPQTETFAGNQEDWAALQARILEPAPVRQLAKQLGTFYALASRFDPHKTLGATMRRAEDLAFGDLERLRQHANGEPVEPLDPPEPRSGTAAPASSTGGEESTATGLLSTIDKPPAADPAND